MPLQGRSDKLAFDASLSWPLRGHKVDENGELMETEPPGMAAIGFDCDYDFLVFHEGRADDEEYVAGFVEGCLERLLDQDEPEESDHLRDLWENGDEENRGYALRQIKEECEVQEGRQNNRPEFPVCPVLWKLVCRESLSYYVEW